MNYAMVAIAVVAASAGVYTLFGTSPSSGVVERAIAHEQCAPVSVDVDFGKRYEGPLIDTHIHIPHIPEGPSFMPSDRPELGGNISLGDYACTFAAEGTSKVFAFFPVFPGFEAQHLAIVKGAREQYPDLFVTFIMPPDRDDHPDGFPTVEASVLQNMLGVYPDIFSGYGEIGLYARGDHGGPTGSPALPPDSARMRAIYPVVREHDLLVYVHLGEGQQASFERALSENPDINFIFHGDQLIVYRENGRQDLTALDEILSRHPNVYYGIDELYGDTWLLRPEGSKEEFFAHFKNYGALLQKDLATWKAFIERHPNQVLWGTDRGASARWTMDADVGIYLTRYARTFIALLDPSVQENFAYKNAERLLLGNAENPHEPPVTPPSPAPIVATQPSPLTLPSQQQACTNNARPVFSRHITDMSKVERIKPPPNKDRDGNLKTHSYLETLNNEMHQPTEGIQ